MFVLASYITAGAFMTQFLTLCASAGTAGLSSSGLLIDNNGFFLGLLQVCGQANFIIVDDNNIPVGGVQNQADDLMYGCPVERIVIGG